MSVLLRSKMKMIQVGPIKSHWPFKSRGSSLAGAEGRQWAWKHDKDRRCYCWLEDGGQPCKKECRK